MYQNVSSTLVFCRGLGCLIFPNQEVKRNQLQNKQTFAALRKNYINRCKVTS